MAREKQLFKPTIVQVKVPLRGYGGFHEFGNKVSAKNMTVFSREFIKEHARDSGVGTALITLCIPYLWEPPNVK